MNGGGWRSSMHARLAGAHDVVRVLMKPRNGEPWTDADRAFLWRELREARTSRLFVVFRVPGSSLFLPALAWALDRRRGSAEGRPSGQRKDDLVGGAIG